MWWLRWHARRLLTMFINPIHPNQAKLWYGRLRWVYLFCGWNAFLIICYKIMQTKKLKKEIGVIEDETPVHNRARMLNIDSGYLINWSVGGGLQKYYYDKNEYERARIEKQKRVIEQKLKDNPELAEKISKMPREQLEALTEPSNFEKLFGSI